MNIIKCTNAHNTTAKKNRSIDYIVLHYTAGVNSKTGTARNIANMFASPNSRQASADFIVDDGSIVQYNPDIKNRYTWAVGGNKYSTMSTSEGGKFYGKCKNNNSISIEMCSRKTNTKSLNASDTDWYLTNATVNNALELTKYLMKMYNVPANRVIMHHHVTGKLCPQPWCFNEGKLKYWNEFKKKLSSGGSAITNNKPVTSNNSINYKVRVTTSDLNIRNGPGTNYGVTGHITNGGVYTIVNESSGKGASKWGKLKSGAGWISLDFTKKV